jgi:hypothetical protein
VGNITQKLDEIHSSAIRAGLFNDSEILEADPEISNHFRENAILFFERELKPNLIDKEIFSEESISYLDKFLKKKIKNYQNNIKYIFSNLAAMYLGEYVISKFDAKWVLDPLCDGGKFPFNYYIFYDAPSFFRPFATCYNRVFLGKKNPVKDEIDYVNHNQHTMRMKKTIFKKEVNIWF